MFTDVRGEWPTYDRFILCSCDDAYLDRYFPRFYKTFTEHWRLPIHVHVVDPSDSSLEKLDKLPVTYSHCEIDHGTLNQPYAHETYCQAQRFILLGHNMTESQSVIVADVDAYALRTPTQQQRDTLLADMAFTTFNGRLMATFCHFHASRRQEARDMSRAMIEMLKETDQIGVDQKVIKEIFSQLPYNELKNGEWIRHWDIKTQKDIKEHNSCLVYHEKGTRGKYKQIEITWTDIQN
jgi:hypothetical protein